MRWLKSVAASMLAVAGSASAFTPENGTWWNPNEPGRGFMMEIQDNFLFLAGFAFSQNGAPLWLTAQGTMNGNARFVGSLTTYTGGQCLGCAYRPATAQVGAGGPIEIVFDTEVSGRMTWGGQTIPIERFDYYLTRTPGDIKTEMMLGEWQATIDFSANTSIGYPYYGDVMVFDRVDRGPSPDVFDGCRANNSLDGRCTQSAIANHDASGFYQASTREHFLVVNDSPTNFAYYVVKTGTYQFDGIMKVCPKSLSNAITQCLQSSSYRAYPVRGQRTASRNFVTTGSGPNEVDKSSRRQSISDALGNVSDGMDNAQVKARYGIDLDTLPVAELMAISERVR